MFFYLNVVNAFKVQLCVVKVSAVCPFCCGVYVYNGFSSDFQIQCKMFVYGVACAFCNMFNFSLRLQGITPHHNFFRMRWQSRILALSGAEGTRNIAAPDMI